MMINGRQIDGTILSDYNMVDVHMHLIPEVDDGSWSLEMSDDMLCMSVTQGIRKIICTSHGFGFREKGNYVKEQFDALKKLAEEKYPEIQLYYGCEVACTRSMMAHTLERLEEGSYPSMCGTKYVLTEFRTTSTPDDILYCAEQLLQNGWSPVIAHIERYKNLFRDETVIARLKEIGCLFQINVYSLFEEETEEIKNAARMLVEKRMADLLGSDAHKTHHRPPRVEAGLKYLYDNFDKDYIDQIAYHNAVKYFNL